MIQPRPLGKSSLRCSLPSHSDFLHQSAWRGCTDVLLPPFLPGPYFWSFWTKIAHLDIPAAENHDHTCLSPSYVDCLRGGSTRINRSMFEVLQLPWMQPSKLCPFCEATRHLAYALMKYAAYLDPSTKVVPDIIYTMEYWIVQNMECDAALWMNSVVTIIYCGPH